MLHGDSINIVSMLVIEDMIPWEKKSQVDYPGYRPEKESSKGEKSAVPEGIT